MTDRTKLILLNTPHNPTGNVATRAELEAVAALAQRHDAYVLADEVYENTTWGGAEHVRIAELPGMRSRTLCVGSASKLFSLTGWRVGWVLAAAPVMRAVRMMHAYSVYCAPAPLQAGIAAAFDAEQGDFEGWPAQIARNFSDLGAAIEAFGLPVTEANGGYFLLADVASTGMNDYDFCKWCIRRVGVACIPLHVFYDRDEFKDCTLVRFCIAKTGDTIARACAAFGKATVTELLAAGGE